MLCAVSACAVIACASGSCARRARPQVHASAVASPAVRGAESGLELWWWVVTDQRPPREFGPVQPTKPGEPPKPRPFSVIDPGEPLEQVLGKYLRRPTPFPDELKARWKAHGLRIVCVPLKDLESVQASLRLTGPVHRQWFGEISDWTDIVRGPEFDSPKLVMIGERAEELRPGRIRLLARCWMYPAASAAGAPVAGLRIELVPQFEPSLTERSRLQVAVTRAQDPTDGMYTDLRAGLSIDRLQDETVKALDAPSAGGLDAVLIVPDRPSEDWTRPKTPEESETGPELDLPPSLGEAMLSAPAVKSASGVVPRSRAVIVLIPRLPERFELLGR